MRAGSLSFNAGSEAGVGGHHVETHSLADSSSMPGCMAVMKR